MSVPSLTGYYGKVPGRGDFISRGLPRDFVAPWDRWLQQSLLLLEGHLGPVWPEWFASLAAVRFALNAGVCGSGAWIGVMVPSHDRVGRRFPLVLCRWMGKRRLDSSIFQQQAAWYESVEKLAEECQAGILEPEALPLNGDGPLGRRWFPQVFRCLSWWWCPVEDRIVKVRGLPEAGVLIEWVERCRA